MTAHVVGVDTISLVFSVDSCTPAGFLRVPDRMRLSVRDGRARVEASLPKRATPGSNIEAIPLDGLKAAALDLLEEAADHVTPIRDSTHPDIVTLTRIDLVREFHDVADTGAVLRGLSGVARRPSLTHNLQGTVAAPSSLRIGTRYTWGCTLYDKHIQTSGRAAAGHLRFEAELRRPRLRSSWARTTGGCVRVLADAEPDKLAALAYGSFEAANFHLAAALPDEVCALAESRFDLPAATRYCLATHMRRKALGLPCTLPRSSGSKYDRLARETLDQAASSGSKHLDWATGSVVG